MHRVNLVILASTLVKTDCMLNFWESNIEFECCLYGSGILGFSGKQTSLDIQHSSPVFTTTCHGDDNMPIIH